MSQKQYGPLFRDGIKKAQFGPSQLCARRLYIQHEAAQENKNNGEAIEFIFAFPSKEARAAITASFKLLLIRAAFDMTRHLVFSVLRKSHLNL